MARTCRFLAIVPASSAGASALAYVPFVIFARALAPLRSFLVAKILGDVGQREFGLYQPALELINCLVPLVLFGLADVAERYTARFVQQNRLASVLRRQLLRLAAVAIPVSLAMIALSPWISRAVWGNFSADESQAHPMLLVAACALTMTLLAFYQHLAATLRGLRAYTAVAGMEFLSSFLLLALSCVAAWRGGAAALVFVYALSLLAPLLIYGMILLKHLKNMPPAVAPPPPLAHEGLHRFAAWALVRLLLVMIFGFLSLWGVRHLASQAAVSHAGDALRQTADYSAPYRMAQVVATLAVALWASTYGVAAAAWSHGQLRRARAQLFRVGKFGAVGLTLAAIILLLARGILAAIFPPAYADSINLFLPPLLAIFIWYGLLAFACTYADLQEKPYLGAWIWAAAVTLQLLLILFPFFGVSDPQQRVVLASAVGLGVGLLLVCPLLLWHPFRMTATSIPLALLALAPLTLFSPGWVVDYLAPLTMLGAVAFLYFTNLLIRPADRRGWRRFRAQGF